MLSWGVVGDGSSESDIVVVGDSEADVTERVEVFASGHSRDHIRYIWLSASIVRAQVLAGIYLRPFEVVQDTHCARLN